MRILIINDNGIEVGGVETYISHLKLYFKLIGHEVKVLTSKPLKKNENSFADYVFEGVNPESPFRLLPYIFNLSSLLKLQQILKEFKPDVVHINFFFYHTSPSILLALKGIPTIMTVHSHELLAPVGTNYQESKCDHPFIGYCIKCCGIIRYYPEKFKRFIFKMLKNTINLYITPSAYYKKIFDLYSFSPVIHVSNGLLTEKDIKPIKVKRIGYKLLFVGRLAKEKGVEYIIKAVPLIKKEFSKVHLVIVGNGEDESRLKKIVTDLSLNKNIKFIGKISNKNVEKYYQNTDIVLVPSVYPDNLPTVCIEAKKYAKPIIGSNIGGIPELVKNNHDGFLVPAEDSKSISIKVLELLQDKKKYSIFSHNSAESAKRYLLSEHVKKLLTSYKKVISNEK